jgi:hypothetical protein
MSNSKFRHGIEQCCTELHYPRTLAELIVVQTMLLAEFVYFVQQHEEDRSVAPGIRMHCAVVNVRRPFLKRLILVRISVSQA